MRWFFLELWDLPFRQAQGTEVVEGKIGIWSYLPRPVSFGCAPGGLLVSVRFTHGADITHWHFRYRCRASLFHFL